MLNMIALKKTHLMLTFAAAMLAGCCKDKKVCSPDTVATDFKIYKADIPCPDLGLPWEVTFGVQFNFDYKVECSTDCTSNRVYYENAAGYIRHVAGGVDTFCCVFSGARCNQDYLPSMIFHSEVDNPNPKNYALGDTIVFELSEGRLCKTDNEGRCKDNEDAVAVLLPAYTYSYVLTAADFDCD